MIGKTNAVAGGVSPIEILSVDTTNRTWVAGSSIDNAAGGMYCTRYDMVSHPTYTGNGSVLIQLDKYVRAYPYSITRSLTIYDLGLEENESISKDALNAMGFNKLPDGTYNVNYVIGSKATEFYARFGSTEVTKSGDTYTYSTIQPPLMDQSNAGKRLIIIGIIPI